LQLGLDVLEYLVENEAPQGVTEVANKLNLTKVRVYRLLQTLTDRGYLVQDPTSSRYAPSVRLLALGQTMADRFEFAALAKPEATMLWERLGHTVVTGTIFRGKVLVLDVIRGRTPISIGLKPGVLLDLHSSSQGLIGLAFGPREQLDAVLNQPLRARTANTITDPAQLAREIRLIRMHGWSKTPNQLVIGMNSIAAPVFQRDGSLAGTLAVTGLTQFVPDPPPPAMIDELTSACWRLSRKLGWSGKIASVPARAVAARPQGTGGVGAVTGRPARRRSAT
jgi:DNA-binding IclR family transcriptional regulator